MTTPDTSLYKDLHDGAKPILRGIKIETLTNYLSGFEKKLDAEKIKGMHDKRFIRNVRHAEDHDSEGLFLRGSVWAEMSKNTSYVVDIKLDGLMVIEEAQCECGAGAGPTAHCKHVQVLFHALANFITGLPLITDLTCTEKLQTFHRTKPNTGTPMKCESMVALRGMKNSPLYDPRPLKYRTIGGTINWQTQTGMPILQLIPPANLHALYHDHQYFEYHMSDHFLRINHISVIDIQKINDIEERTRDQNKSSEWYTAREMRMTSSSFGKICKSKSKCDNWKSNGCPSCNGQCDEVCPMVKSRREKLAINLLTHRTELNTKPIRHGKQYESVAIKKFQEMEAVSVKECGLFVSAEKPCYGASPDGLLGDEYVIEIKCPFTAKGKTISHETVDYCTPDGTLKTNHDYYYQVQGQLYCTEKKMAKFIIFTIKDIKVINIPRDDVFITKMISQLDAFYKSYFMSAMLNKYLYKNYYSYTFK